jgi:PAS domain S-box-containing protein
LAAIVEGSDDAIISKTLDGVITSWNKAAEILYGYSAAEAIGQPISLLTPPDGLDEVHNILKKIGQNERIVHYETIRLRKDGQKINISLSVSPLKNDVGELIGASSIARDISERERVRKEREKLIAELQEALAKVKTLKGLLPICAWCKKIRDDQGYWQQIEAYLHDHSEADFSHGICPECAHKVLRRPNDH